MGKEVATVRGVRNHYGARDTGGGLGHQPTYGVENELTFDFGPEVMGYTAPFKVYATIPKGAQTLNVAYYIEATGTPVLTGSFLIKAGNTGNVLEIEGTDIDVTGWGSTFTTATGVFATNGVAGSNLELTVDKNDLALTSGVLPRVRVVITYRKTVA